MVEFESEKFRELNVEFNVLIYELISAKALGVSDKEQLIIEVYDEFETEIHVSEAFRILSEIISTQIEVTLIPQEAPAASIIVDEEELPISFTGLLIANASQYVSLHIRIVHPECEISIAS